MRLGVSDSVSVAVETLAANPLRTLLSTLGVIIGVASLVSVLAIGDSMERLAPEEIERTTGVQTVVLVPQTTTEINGETQPRRDYPIFAPADAPALEAEGLVVTAKNLMVSGTGVVEAMSGRSRAATLHATLPSIRLSADLALSAGRFFTEAELRRRTPVIVLSYRLAEALTADGRAERLLNHWVRVNGTPVQVVGVLRAYAGERTAVAYVPYAARRQAGIGVAAPPPALFVKARTIEDVANVESAAQGWLAHRLGAWEGRVRVETSVARLAQVNRGMQTFRLFLGSITGISLVVGGIGIMNVLLASVTERTREIGIRVALGARKRDILMQFLAESVAISTAGSIVGVVLGMSVTGAVALILRMNSEARIAASFSVTSVLLAIGAAVAVGLCCGVYPALRASRLSPIDAIRTD